MLTVLIIILILALVLGGGGWYGTRYGWWGNRPPYNNPMMNPEQLRGTGGPYTVSGQVPYTAGDQMSPTGQVPYAPNYNPLWIVVAVVLVLLVIGLLFSHFYGGVY